MTKKQKAILNEDGERIKLPGDDLEAGDEVGTVGPTEAVDEPTTYEAQEQKAGAVGEFDADEWVKAWMRAIDIDPELPTDQEAMRGWFANAIMAGHDQAIENAQIEDHERQVEDEVEAWQQSRIDPDSPKIYERNYGADLRLMQDVAFEAGQAFALDKIEGTLGSFVTKMFWRVRGKRAVNAVAKFREIVEMIGDKCDDLKETYEARQEGLDEVMNYWANVLGVELTFRATDDPFGIREHVKEGLENGGPFSFEVELDEDGNKAGVVVAPLHEMIRQAAASGGPFGSFGEFLTNLAEHDGPGLDDFLDDFEAGDEQEKDEAGDDDSDTPQEQMTGRRFA